jgi:two-component system chemotaxis response regulator CheB
MAKRDLVVIGGSAGAVEALVELVGVLPRNLATPLLVVVHIPATAESHLPQILERGGVLPADHAVDGDALQDGRILVAPPDFHMTIRDWRVRLERGPRENHHRPAVDPLLRSAARWHDGRTIAVILSGGAGDGLAGCLAVRRRGGIILVQDPQDAIFDGMPRSVSSRIEVDAMLPAVDLGSAIARLVGTKEAPMTGVQEHDSADVQPFPSDEVVRMEREGMALANMRADTFGCPDCGGVLQPIDEGEWLRFRCMVGHAYSPEALLDAQADALESALWSAVRNLEERSELLRRLADRTADRAPEVAGRYQRRSDEASHEAGVIRRFLLSPGVIGPEVRSLPEAEAVGSG